MGKTLLLLILSLCLVGVAQAGPPAEQALAPSLALLVREDLAEPPLPLSTYVNGDEGWLNEMSRRLAVYWSDDLSRKEFLNTVRYEALRAELDPQLVLGIIHVESGFHQYAVSTAGALGFMQVMPFWAKQLGHKEHELFQLRLNLRYGCSILRYYLAQEQGNLARALQRYNGSFGQNNYPSLVLNVLHKHWHY